MLPSRSDKMENISILQYKISSLGTVTKSGTAGISFLIYWKLYHKRILLQPEINVLTELADFQPNLPYPIQRISQTFFADIAPNDCQKTICKPDLRFKAEWFDVVKNLTLDSHSNQSNPIILGSISKVVFKLVISNFNETAIRPSYSIEWPRNIGVVVDDEQMANKEKDASDNLFVFLQTDSCKENNLASKIVYNCIFPNDITQAAPVSTAWFGSLCINIIHLLLKLASFILT